MQQFPTSTQISDEEVFQNEVDYLQKQRMKD
jgi:hypothetical protein